MSVGLILLVLFGVVSGIVAVLVLLDLPPFGGRQSPRASATMRSMMGTRTQQRTQSGQKQKGSDAFIAAASSTVTKKTGAASLTMAKRLKFATWKMNPATFHLIEVSLGFVLFVVATQYVNIILQVVAFASGPLFMRFLLNRSMQKRFNAFDKDYPAFLSQVVSLLKTGMNTVQALEAASQGLEADSLVRMEVELMVERMRLGIPEDKSIGSFGEDIFHSEIELFVQALLLSKRVGGTLSDTLDRLAKQCRKRQFFRLQAQAAVGMQRGSIYFILVILVFIELYLLFVFPEAVIGGLKDPTGWQVWQVAIVLILLGLYWVRQVTKFKI